MGMSETQSVELSKCPTWGPAYPLAWAASGPGPQQQLPQSLLPGTMLSVPQSLGGLGWSAALLLGLLDPLGQQEPCSPSASPSAGQQLMLTADPATGPPPAGFPYGYATAPAFTQSPVYSFSV